MSGIKVERDTPSNVIAATLRGALLNPGIRKAAERLVEHFAPESPVFGDASARSLGALAEGLEKFGERIEFKRPWQTLLFGVASDSLKTFVDAFLQAGEMRYGGATSGGTHGHGPEKSHAQGKALEYQPSLLVQAVRKDGAEMVKKLLADAKKPEDLELAREKIKLWFWFLEDAERRLLEEEKLNKPEPLPHAPSAREIHKPIDWKTEIAGIEAWLRRSWDIIEPQLQRLTPVVRYAADVAWSLPLAKPVKNRSLPERLWRGLVWVVQVITLRQPNRPDQYREWLERLETQRTGRRRP